ncbi:arginine deiminase family protein [bacterium]|nr:arginine deiminase family protein [bacterium]
MFSKAIVRIPGKSLINGLTDSEYLGSPDYSQAIIQHKQYVEALKLCGLQVIVLESCEEYPDSTFVEDVALITPKCAIITRPGAQSRRGETEQIEPVLKSEMSIVEHIKSPGTIEAGDIMMVGNHYYIGLSDRTNAQGAEQMIAILNKYGYTGSTVELNDVLHLKTGLSYLENNMLAICGEFKNDPVFSAYEHIEISDKESYAANCIWVNDNVIIPFGYPATKEKMSATGYTVIEVDVSEFKKLDGGLSCLSLRY